MEKKPYTNCKKTASCNILTRLLGVTGKAKNAKTILETWKCYIYAKYDCKIHEPMHQENMMQFFPK